MEKPTDTGPNRTGIATSPIDSKKLIEASEQLTPFPGIDGAAVEAERVRWTRSAPPVGTVPPPGTLKGMAKTLLEKVQGHQPTVLVDKLGQRLAYERTGTRLYEALLAKLAAADVHEGGPTRAELEEIRDQEHQHMQLVMEAIRQLGADPTAMTPCADVTGVAGLGWIQVLGDPRTTLTQCLDVMLVVEHGDVEGWTLLGALADALGFDDIATQFRAAQIVEELHATKLRGWVASAVLGQAGVQETPLRVPHHPART